MGGGPVMTGGGIGGDKKNAFAGIFMVAFAAFGTFITTVSNTGCITETAL